MFHIHLGVSVAQVVEQLSTYPRVSSSIPLVKVSLDKSLYSLAAVQP